jgi:hypothetical protein
VQNDAKEKSFKSKPSFLSLTSDRRRHEGRRLLRFHRRCNRAFACVLGLASLIAVGNRALAQQPMISPAPPIPHPVTSRPFHLWDCFLPDDGIPRTYSYYYTPWLNQPRHFPFVGPDGRKYWRSTVRGVPMGMQWAAP